MTFRDIDAAMLNLVDPETGEIMDVQAFNDLQMERDRKVENMALWVLDLKDESAAIDAEIERLRKRKEAIDSKAKRLRDYIPVVAGGQKIKTPRVSVYYMQTESAQVVDPEKLIKWAQDTNQDDQLLRYAKPEINRTAVKKLFKAGEIVPGATLVQQISTVIR